MDIKVRCTKSKHRHQLSYRNTNQQPSDRKNNNSDTTPPKEKPKPKSTQLTKTDQHPNKRNSYNIPPRRSDGSVYGFKGSPMDIKVRCTPVPELL